jgi:integrase
MARITQKDIDTLAPKVNAGDKLVEDWLWDNGFAVKVTAARKKVFYVGYRMGGRETQFQKFKLGDYGKMTLAQARKQAEKVQAKIALGIDPAEEKRKEKKAKRALIEKGTLRQCVERYWELNKKSGRYWLHKRARLLGEDMKGLLGKPIGTIKRSDIQEVLDSVRSRSQNAARLLLVDLRPFFKWAVKRDLMEKNPTEGIDALPPAKVREHVLEVHEVAAFWKATGEMTWPFASIYRLLLLTGTRRDEVAGMRWDELDLDNALWLIPGSRTKNGRPHRLPLDPEAVAMLDRAAIAAIKQGYGYQDGELAFSTTGTTPPSGWSKAKLTLDKRMKALLGARFQGWRVHDLRRTCATGMEDLGVPTRVVETALNHVSGTKAGIVGVYQRAEHREAVKTAFAAWARRVMEIVGGGDGGSNVVPLRKAG